MADKHEAPSGYDASVPAAPGSEVLQSRLPIEPSVSLLERYYSQHAVTRPRATFQESTGKSELAQLIDDVDRR
jgi:hypothetical protein